MVQAQERRFIQRRGELIEPHVLLDHFDGVDLFGGRKHGFFDVCGLAVCSAVDIVAKIPLGARALKLQRGTVRANKREKGGNIVPFEVDDRLFAAEHGLRFRPEGGKHGAELAGERIRTRDDLQMVPAIRVGTGAAAKKRAAQERASGFVVRNQAGGNRFADGEFARLADEQPGVAQQLFRFVANQRHQRQRTPALPLAKLDGGFQRIQRGGEGDDELAHGERFCGKHRAATAPDGQRAAGMDKTCEFGKANPIRLEPDLDEVFFCAAGKRHACSESFVFFAAWRLCFLL